MKKILSLTLLLSCFLVPAHGDTRKDIKSHDKKFDAVEDALGALAEQMFYFQYQIEALEQRMHDIELKQEYNHGKHCINASI